MIETIEESFHGDRPIKALAEDRLGFSTAATHVAHAIHRMASPDGFVVGIEGEWGSGKSSFINLVSEALRSVEDQPELVSFLPWLISSRDSLLKELFTEINKAAIRIEVDEPCGGWWNKLRAKALPRRYSARAIRRRRLRTLFSRFSSRLVQAGKVAELFGLVGAGAATEAGKRSVDEWLANVSLVKEKTGIQDELRKLKRKIVIFIDDIDRLEPDEVVEVLRLVRAVVDFPNVVFVLCYSQDIIAENLSTALHIQRGHEFLEKIVQVSFPVPQPEAFELRSMFRHDLHLLYPDLLQGDSDRARSTRDRLAQIIDGEGGRALLTPRHVVRAINALRFHATSVLGDIDISDMVWLQLVKIQSPRLHKWIEGYLIGFEAKHNGAMVTEESKNAELLKLKSILDEMSDADSSRVARREALTTILPGVDFTLEDASSNSATVLSIYGDADVPALVKKRRLGSPQHFRYYFALSAPKNAISDREFSTFLDSAKNSPESAVNQFARLSTTPTTQGRLASQALMDRLKDSDIQTLPADALSGILQSLANCMDEAALRTGRGDWGEYWIWRDADRIFDSIWPRVPADMRNGIIENIFRTGTSIGWLTEMFRNEIFAHGIYGDQAKPESQWLFSHDEINIVATELLRRYRSLTPNDLERLPRVASLLFAWLQFKPSSLSEIQAKVEELCRNDADLLKFLQRMRSWRATNGIVSYPLTESNLSLFMDVNQLRDRLAKISASSSLPDENQAMELLNAIVKDNVK